MSRRWVPAGLFVAFCFGVAGVAPLANGAPTQPRDASAPKAQAPEAISPSARPDIYKGGWIDLNKNGRRDVYEDRSASTDERVEDLLALMTVAEKTCQMATLYGYQRVLMDDLPTDEWRDAIWKDGIANIDEHLNGIPGWRGKPESPYVSAPSQHARAINEVQRWFVEETRLGIPVDFTNEGIRGLCYWRATNFPAQIGIGATWNPDLVRKIGRATGREAKAVGYTNIYSPILDLARDPRWGRVVECYGESPYHVSQMGIAQSSGLRESGVASTLKHFAVYSVPKGGRDGNARTDPQVGARAAIDLYLAPFAAVIREAGALGVMSSYNDYEGVPVSANRELLIDELRGRMGFRGYVVSDSGAVKQLHTKHGVASSADDAVRLFAENGGNVCTDFAKPDRFIQTLRRLLSSGELATSVVDDRVRDVLRVKFELGLFDQPFVGNPDEADSVVACDEHAELSLEAARQSLVLLKNDADALPMAKNLGSILVCGPNAKATGHSISRYGPVGGSVVSVFDAISDAVSQETKVRYSLGARVVDAKWPESELYDALPHGEDAQLIDAAVAAARDVDTVVLVLGESESTIGESKSRTSLRLTGHQRALAQALVATGKPVVVVLINGRALAVNWLDKHVLAILEAWFPGQCCGTAIAEALFGEYNPGGKLPITVPKSVGQLPLNFPFKRGSHAGQGKGHNPNGIGNSRVTGPLYPFGHGVSYTEFEYRDLSISATDIGPDESVTVTCRVANVGQRAGDEVVQLYVRDDYSSVVTYDRLLRGFERVTLSPGEDTLVHFRLPAETLSVTGSDLQRRVEPGTFSVLVGSSSEDIRLKGAFRVHERSVVAGSLSGDGPG